MRPQQMTSERRRLLMGTAWTLTATAASLVIGVVLRPVLVFFVGVSGYGIWAAALAITSLFGLLGDVGVGAALTRLVAERKGRQADMGTFSGSALLFGIICGAASGLILATLSGSIERATAFPGLAALLMLQAIQMPVNLGTAALFGLLQGSRNFRSIAVFTISQSLGNLALAVALLVLGFGLVGVMFASLGVAAIVFIVVLAASTRTLRLGGLAALKGDLRDLLPFGAQLTATNGRLASGEEA